MKFKQICIVLSIVMIPFFYKRIQAQERQEQSEDKKAPSKEFQRIYNNIGFAPAFLDFYGFPYRNNNADPNATSKSPQFYKEGGLGFSLVTFIYRFRYNILEVSNNSAIGLSATPALGLSFSYTDVTSDLGLFHINMPIAVGWEFGAGSTYYSELNHGGVIGLGIDYSLLPLIWDGAPAIDRYSYINLHLNFGYRYWSRRNRLWELNLKVMTGPSYAGKNSSDNSLIVPPWGVRISWLRFLNY